MQANASYHTGQQRPLAVLQTSTVQPPRLEAMSGQPGPFRAALGHQPLRLLLPQQNISVIQSPTDVEMDDADGPQNPVTFHSPRQGNRSTPPAAQDPDAPTTQAKAHPDAQPGAAESSSRASGTSTSGCCDDIYTFCMLDGDDASCAALLNACCRATLGGCGTLARGIGTAARECLPSSQSIHESCETLAGHATSCCQAFGHCVGKGLGVCKDLITCPCTVCGEICKACCEGLGHLSCDCCSGCDCHCGGCDCGDCDCNC